jgi:hypothetical protein
MQKFTLQCKIKVIMAKNTTKDYEKMGRMLEDIFASGSGNLKSLLWYNFVKGIAYGLGIFLGGTIIIAIVMWLLNLFNQVPLIGPLVQNIINSLY